MNIRQLQWYILNLIIMATYNSISSIYQEDFLHTTACMAITPLCPRRMTLTQWHSNNRSHHSLTISNSGMINFQTKVNWRVCNFKLWAALSYFWKHFFYVDNENNGYGSMSFWFVQYIACSTQFAKCHFINIKIRFNGLNFENRENVIFFFFKLNAIFRAALPYIIKLKYAIVFF